MPVIEVSWRCCDRSAIAALSHICAHLKCSLRATWPRYLNVAHPEVRRLASGCGSGFAHALRAHRQGPSSRTPSRERNHALHGFEVSGFHNGHRATIEPRMAAHIPHDCVTVVLTAHTWAGSVRLNTLEIDHGFRKEAPSPRRARRWGLEGGGEAAEDFTALARASGSHSRGISPAEGPRSPASWRHDSLHSRDPSRRGTLRAIDSRQGAEPSSCPEKPRSPC
jgi:hypothetical protein